MLKKVTVAEIAAPEPRSIAIGPFGSSLKAEMYEPSGVPVVRGQNISSAPQIDETDLVFVSPETAGKLSACLVSEGDLVFPHRGAIGRVGIVGSRSMLLSSSMMKLRCDRTKVDPRFILYYFRGPGKDQLLMRASTVGTPGIGQPLTSLRNIPIEIPTLPQQQAIAEVLGALDDKIAANAKMASTADEWIRAEYDKIAFLSDKIRTVAELVSHRRNTANPGLFEFHVPYVGLEHIPRRSMWLDNHGSSDEVSSNKSHFQNGDILFGKLRPYFHKVVTAPKAGICSTDVLVLTPSEEALSGFVLAALTHDSVIQAVTAASEGTRMPRTSWKDLSSVEVPWPGQMVAAALSTKVQDIRKYVINVLAENQTLAETRDALLPQLMSGKLRIKEAEEIVATAI